MPARMMMTEMTTSISTSVNAWRPPARYVVVRRGKSITAEIRDVIFRPVDPIDAGADQDEAVLLFWRVGEGRILQGRVDVVRVYGGERGERGRRVVEAVVVVL